MRGALGFVFQLGCRLGRIAFEDRHVRGLRFALAALLVSLLPQLDAPHAAVLQAAEPPASTATAPRDAETAKADGIAFFEKRIRPLLAEHCYSCHGDEEQESDLRLDSFGAMMQGGASGDLLVPGKPAESLLFHAVSYEADLQMPPDERLPDAKIADIRRWIELGAPHPNADGTSIKPRRVDLESGRQFWAFQPVTRPELPSVSNPRWPSTPIDFFMLRQLDQQGLVPVGSADRVTLIRRLTYDLHGLPPTPQQIEAFVSDPAPDAYERLVEQLLASPRYGERWGRHWLDVARYADSNGLDENLAHGNAWRYRDYVIDSFNADKPFDRMIREQLAGDQLLAADWQQEHEQLVATGFLSLGPKVLAEVDETKMEMDIIDEQIDTVGRAFLGLTFGCARCHDHKFDPIRMDDYYALAGIFKSSRTMEHFTKIAKWYEHEIPTPAEKQVLAEHREAVESKKQEIDERVASAKQELLATLGEGATVPQDLEQMFPDEVKKELKTARDELKKLESQAPEVSSAMGVSEGDVMNVAIHLRGSHLALGKEVARGAPAVLLDQPLDIPNDRSGRLALAEWLASDQHPLTSRVIANRIWRWHFGRGLVSTVDNFGRLGERPTHPELLDWLASELTSNGWSLKHLHRQILLSSTYRMSSEPHEENLAIDPSNRWQWRTSLRRLTAEEVRDSLLAVARQLDYEMGGSMLHVKNREFIFNHTSRDETTYNEHRRSVYLPVIRNHLFDVFQLFDYTDASVSTGNRSSTTVAPQALFLMNSDFVRGVSRTLARQLIDEHSTTEERLSALFHRTLGRAPTESDVQRSSQFLARFAQTVELPPAPDDVNQLESRSWTALCQIVLASNEYFYLR